MAKSKKELGQELVDHIAKRHEYSDTRELKALIDAGASLEERDADGNTPLILTGIHGMPEVAKWLMDAKANINAVNNKGYSTLLYSLEEPSMAMDRGDDEYLPIAKALLDRPDIDVNLTPTAGNLKFSPLTVAAGRFLYKFVEDIAARGADLDYEDWTHETAMMKAKKSDNGKATVHVLENAFEQREIRREEERKVEKAEQLRQTVIEVTTIVARGAGSDMQGPEKATFAKRPRKFENPI